MVAAGEALAADAGLEVVDVDVRMPRRSASAGPWATSPGCATTSATCWPDCEDDLTKEIAFGLELAEQVVDLATCGEGRGGPHPAANEAMAAVFDQVDFVICATNPDVAFPAEIVANTRVGGTRRSSLENNGALTIPDNISGNPSLSMPVEPLDGLPVGMQVIGRHHDDALLLDLGAIVEAGCPWPLVAPGAPV